MSTVWVQLTIVINIRYRRAHVALIYYTGILGQSCASVSVI